MDYGFLDIHLYEWNLQKLSRRCNFVLILELKLGSVVIEGKTKIVYDLPDRDGQVFIQSKDRITAGDGAKSHAMEGKAAISTSTTSSIFNLLNTAGNNNI